MGKFIDGAKHGLGIVFVVGLFAMGTFFIKAWTGNGSLEAQTGDTLTAQKWNELAGKLEGIKSIQYGVVGNGTNGGAGGLDMHTNITFTKPFANIPIIHLTSDESVNQSGPIGCRIHSKTNTGFSFRCFNSSASINVDYLNRIAIEPY